MLDNIIICRLYRTIWRPKKATKSATFEIPNWFHKSLKNQRHICSTFIRKFVNDVWSSKQWTSDSLEQRLFLRPFWPYLLHTFSLVSLVKKYATCKAKMAFQKAFVHGNLTFIVFLIPSLTFFIMNVEKIQSFICKLVTQLQGSIFLRYLIRFTLIWSMELWMDQISVSGSNICEWIRIFLSHFCVYRHANLCSGLRVTIVLN